MAKAQRKLDAVAGAISKVTLETAEIAQPDQPVTLDTSKRSWASLIQALTIRAGACGRAADHVGEGLLSTIAVSAGKLKRELGEARGHFTGETADLIDRLYEIL